MSIYYQISDNVDVELVAYEEPICFSNDTDRDELSDFIKIMTGKNQSFPDRYIKAFKTLGLTTAESMLSLPRYVTEQHIDLVRRSITDILSSEENREYLKHYLEIKRFLNSLSPPRGNKPALISLINNQKHDGPKNSISQFLPKNDFIPKTSYSNSRTSTGRLTVVSGPNILTVPSKTRECFISSFQSGRLLQIDIVAAEPKFALCVKGDAGPADVYSHLSKVIFSGSISRKQVKIATLCALYGQSASNLSKQLSAGQSASRVIEKIRRYFDYRSLRKNLDLAACSGNLRNALGRPLVIADRGVLVSHFLQSSVAEASILMFSDFCKKNPGLKPNYVIHDALIVDTPKSFWEQFNDGDTVDLFFNDWKFESKVNFLDNT